MHFSSQNITIYSYPFGMIMPERTWTSDSVSYRYSFNGYEKLDELYGEGSGVDFGERIYDGRLGRFLSADPKEEEYPWQTTYAYYSNSPISIIDYEGMGAAPDDIAPVVTKTKIKVRNKIDIDTKKIVPITLRFKVRGRNKVMLNFDANSQPGRIQIYRVYFYIFKIKKGDSETTTGKFKKILERGRYVVKIDVDIFRSEPYKIRIRGAMVRKKEVSKHRWRLGGRDKERGKWENVTGTIPKRLKVKSTKRSHQTIPK
jgi:RHS repeat-associated protein